MCDFQGLRVEICVSGAGILCFNQIPYEHSYQKSPRLVRALAIIIYSLFTMSLKPYNCTLSRRRKLSIACDDFLCLP